MDITQLANEAYEFLDKGDVESTEDILKSLMKEEMTAELKYTISALLIEIGTASKNMSYIDEGIKNFNEIKNNTQYESDYNLANGYSSKYKIMDDKPNYLTKDTHLLTKAKRLYLTSINKTPLEQLPLLYVNLANTYNLIGRTLDALEYYEKIPENPYSLINKGIGLYTYSTFNTNPTPLLKEAYDCFKSVLETPNIPVEFESICSKYMQNIEKLCGKTVLEHEINKSINITSKENFEGFIIEFCLKHKLYLNFCSFCQRCDNAIGDSIIIPNMVVKISESIDDDPYIKLSSQLNQIKMDYASSRFLLILSQTESPLLNLISKNITLTDTLSYEENNMSVQLLKDSFIGFYNILDKISHLINKYFKLQKDPKYLNFHNVWNNRYENINGTLRSQNNMGLNALYDIHLELEPNNEKYYLRKLRNNLTHNFIEVKLFKTHKENLTYEELKNYTIELGKIVKNAIIYLIRAIDITEQKKYQKNKNKIIPKMTRNVIKL